MPVAPTLLPSLGQERHEDGVKTVCQQFGFCQRLGNIAPTLFNVTDSSHLKGADFIYQGQFTRHEASPCENSWVMFDVAPELRLFFFFYS